MKKIYLIIPLIITIFFGINKLNADCESAKERGENLIVSLSPATLMEEENQIKVVLSSEEIYLEVTNNYNDEKNVINSEDGSDIIKTIISPDKYKNIKYEIKTFYTDQTCGTDPIKTYTYETGIYNKFSDSEECWDKPHLNVCKDSFNSKDIEKYYGKDKELSEKNLEEVIEKEEKEENKKKDKTIMGVIKEYYLYVLIPILVISIVYIIIIIVIKRRKKLKDEQI